MSCLVVMGSAVRGVGHMIAHWPLSDWFAQAELARRLHLERGFRGVLYTRSIMQRTLLFKHPFNEEET
jgi:hypothetical protein